jgi:hypothetical protein
MTGYYRWRGGEPGFHADLYPILAGLPDDAEVDATGTARRLQGLVYVGWPPGQLAARLGWPGMTVVRVLGGSGQVTAGRARKVVALYDELWCTAPPETTRAEQAAAAGAREMARDAGWAAPGAYTEGGIDDPAAGPVDGWRPTGKHRTSAAMLEDADWLASYGMIHEQQAARLEMNPKSLEKARRRRLLDETDAA